MVDTKIEGEEGTAIKSRTLVHSAIEEDERRKKQPSSVFLLNIIIPPELIGEVTSAVFALKRGFRAVFDSVELI